MLVIDVADSLPQKVMMPVWDICLVLDRHVVDMVKQKPLPSEVHRMTQPYSADFADVTIHEIAGMRYYIACGEEFILLGTLEHFYQYEGPLDVVVDCGAHVGELSIAAAKRGGTQSMGY